MLENPIVLRPLRLVELLDAAFRLYRRNFLTFVGIMAIMQIPVSLLNMGASITTLVGTKQLASTGQFNQNYFLGLGGIFFTGIISFFLVQGLASAALSRSISASYLGARSGVIESYQKLRPSASNLLLSLLFAGLVSLGISIWTFIPCIGWLSGVGMGLYFTFVVIQLLVPIVVLEKRGPVSALRRAWQLARQRFWWLLGLVGIMYLLNLVLIGPGLILNYALGFAMQGSVNTPNFATSGTISTLVSSLVSMLVGILYHPLQLSVMVLTYFDLRVRSEGLDLALQSSTGSEHPDPLESLAAAPAAPEEKPLIKGMEFGYFVSASLGGILLIGLAYGLVIGILLGLSAFFGSGGF